ncbi:hypothetical protein [Methylocaldum sp. GT1BB]|uniref:hypothetical protein n=1 Tax=Methylocaldum sp. GT1BB TaxID=3438963 RepID=UPI003DA16161
MGFASLYPSYKMNAGLKAIWNKPVLSEAESALAVPGERAEFFRRLLQISIELAGLIRYSYDRLRVNSPGDKTMKSIVIRGVIVFVSIAGEAMAACTGPNLNQIQLSTALSGMTVCATRGAERWQEQHQGTGSGTLVDYKNGPSDPVDPSETVGTWSISGTGANAVVRYDYGSGGTYDYRVYGNGGNSYSFCNASSGEEIVGTVVSSPSCP